MVVVWRQPATTSSIHAVCSLRRYHRLTTIACVTWKLCFAALARCLPSASRTVDWWTFRYLGRCWNWCVVATWVMLCRVLAAVALCQFHAAVMTTSRQPSQWPLHQWTHGTTVKMLYFCHVVLDCCHCPCAVMETSSMLFGCWFSVVVMALVAPSKWSYVEPGYCCDWWPPLVGLPFQYLSRPLRSTWLGLLYVGMLNEYWWWFYLTLGENSKFCMALGLVTGNKCPVK